MPWPTARKAVPIAAVVFPLPGPGFTIMRPRRTSVMVRGRLILLETLFGGVQTLEMTGNARPLRLLGQKNSNKTPGGPLFHIGALAVHHRDRPSPFQFMVPLQKSRTFHGTPASNIPYRVQADLCPLADCGGLVVRNNCLVL